MNSSGPIIIGGVGGSGTRIFADVLQAMGCHIGGNLNGASDFLTFSLLTRNAPRIPLSAETVERIGRLLRRERMSCSDVAAILREVGFTDRGDRAALRRRWRWGYGALTDRGPRVEGPWGFKAPRTARHIPEFAAGFPDMRFLHVVRHGLDMALSSNVNQLRRWGPRMGVNWSGAPEDRSAAQLEFWLRATRETHRIGTETLGDNYRMMRFDDMVREPRNEASKIAEWIGFEGAVDDLIAGIDEPASSGRWRSVAELFSDVDRDAVAAWGFDTARSR